MKRSRLLRDVYVSNGRCFVPLTKNLRAEIDISDAGLVGGINWHAYSGRSGHVYAAKKCQLNGKRFLILMHRLIIDADDSLVVDHINGDGLDNRRSNLRVCTQAENARNRRMNRNNRSGLKGVSFVASRGKWFSGITVSGRHKSLGWFSTAEDASQAYKKASLDLHGEFGRFE